MQWMQIKRPLFTLASSATVFFLCLAAPNSFAQAKKAMNKAELTELRLQRLTDPTPGAPQPSVRHIETPQALAHLPVSNVLQRQAVAPGYKVLPTYKLKPFSRIVADSDISITLRNAQTPQVAVMNRDKPGRELVVATVKEGTLYLQDTAGYCPSRIRCEPLQVLVDANGVNLVHLHHKSSLYAPNYNAQHFSVISHTSGNIIVHGALQVSHIEQYGPGMISIDGIQTKKLEIFSNSPGLVRLAGSVDSLDVRTINNGRVDAKYLAANEVLVQSSGNSEVAVRPTESLNGFASGYSHIYYYKTPSFITPRTYASGNILQMQYWD